MKAIVYREYGSPDVLHIDAVPQPTPQADEIRVRVHTTPVNFGDLLARDFKSVSPRQFNMPALFWLPARLAFGWNKPRNPILGSEFAGVVDAVGADVTKFKIGDTVFGYRGQAMRTYAEYVCIKQDGLVTHKPQNMSFAEAAAVPYGAITALSLLRGRDIQPGQRVLVNGASGAIGTYAMQFAKYFGAEVTGVASTPRLAYMKANGADHVIDYTTTDVTQNGQTYDLIVDVLGKLSFRKVKGSLSQHGCYLPVSFKFREVWQMVSTSLLRRDKRVVCALSSEKQTDLETIRDLAETGAVRSVVDQCFPMEQAAEAHRYAESGQKRGHVVISFEHAPS